MQHGDRDDLAVGEQEDEDALRDHIATCTGCRTELLALRRSAPDAAHPGSDGQLDGPPPRVWESIASELGLAGAARPVGRLGAPAAPRSSYGLSPLPAVDAPPSPVPVDPPSPRATAQPARASSTPRRERAGRRSGTAGRRSTLWLASAGAAAVGLVAGLVVGPERAEGPAGGEQVVASSTLAALPGTPAGVRGEAQVTRTGRRTQLRVAATGLPDTDGFYEVWMLNSSTGAMRSMGVLSTAGPTTLPVAADVDLAQLPEVEVSVEPYDGDEAPATGVLHGRLRG